MALTITSLIITCVIIYAIYLLATRFMHGNLFYKQASKFQGPVPLPLVGNAHIFHGTTEDVLTKFFELGHSYPSPYRLWFGHHFHVVISNPEQIKAVCLSPKTVERGDLINYMRPWIGEGIITAPALKWRVHRKFVQPNFNQKILNSYVEIFAAQSKILCNKLERLSNGPEFKIMDVIKPCTFDMICETAMGVKIGAQTDDNSYYMDVADKLEAIFCKRMVTPWLFPDFIFNFTQYGKDQKKYSEYLHKFSNNLIESKKKELENYVEDSEWKLLNSKKALLDCLLKQNNDSGAKLSDKEVREEVDTIIVAAHDSTATTTAFLMLMLASYPDIQEKVYQELCEIYGNEDIDEREVTQEDLSRMNYLERVIKETTRLFPFFAYTLRKVLEDFDLDENQTLPKGCTVISAVVELHRNEKYWPDPFRFDPDRFLPQEIAKRQPYSYMAFSAGPRNCIGVRYAMMLMKIMQATILRKYKLKKDKITPIKDIRLQLDVVLKPVIPITLKIEKRNQNLHKTII